jgi:hypothetical protein
MPVVSPLQSPKPAWRVTAGGELPLPFGRLAPLPTKKPAKARVHGKLRTATHGCHCNHGPEPYGSGLRNVLTISQTLRYVNQAIP